MVNTIVVHFVLIRESRNAGIDFLAQLRSGFEEGIGHPPDLAVLHVLRRYQNGVANSASLILIKILIVAVVGGWAVTAVLVVAIFVILVVAILVVTIALVPIVPIAVLVDLAT